jgi:hypothetical protein
MSHIVHPVERRRDTRRSVDMSAVIARWPSSPNVLGETALVEEMGPFGFRLRTGLELRPEDVIRVIPQGAAIPLYARIIWTHRDGLIEKGRDRRVGAAHVAGCATLDGPPDETRAGNSAPLKEFLASVVRGIGWALFFAALLGIMASAGYLLFSLMRLMM